MEGRLAIAVRAGSTVVAHRQWFAPLVGGASGVHSWCLCAARWKEAMTAGAAPLVNLGATHIKETVICSFHLHFQFHRNQSFNCFFMQFSAETVRELYG